MKTRSEILTDMGSDLKELGGHLECEVCGWNQTLGNIGANLSEGWPKHCGYTMRWITAKQEAEAAASNTNPAPTGETERAE